MAKKKDMSKCLQCKNLDREKSNGSWTVCPIMPVDVMLNGSSLCKEFKSIKEANK